jgi:hypothetical protein
MLVLDAIEMLDGLGVANFSVAGHDWGANMAGMLVATLSSWPRVEGPLPSQGKQRSLKTDRFVNREANSASLRSLRPAAFP